MLARRVGPEHLMPPRVFLIGLDPAWGWRGASPTHRLGTVQECATCPVLAHLGPRVVCPASRLTLVAPPSDAPVSARLIPYLGP